MHLLLSKGPHRAQNKTATPGKNVKAIFIAILIGLLAAPGCKKSPAPTSTYKQVNLVSDTSSYGAAKIDAQLVNPWGIVYNPTASAFWIGDNGTGVSSVYSPSGTQALTAVNIPTPLASTGGAVSGMAYNSTNDFGGAPLIFVTEDGTISAWTSGANATVKVDSSSIGSVFKGVALANDGTGNFIFVADFHNNKVDVFNSTFTPVPGRSFVDPSMPAGYAPFNIQAINGQLYIVFDKQDAVAHDDVAGPGNGYISVFNYNGTFVKRFASQGTLNSPWAIVPAPSGFGQSSGDILVGNFGDGAINVFDGSGNYQSQLKNSNSTVINIKGLWGLAFGPGTNNQLFFTAGPGAESHGLFGYLQQM